MMKRIVFPPTPNSAADPGNGQAPYAVERMSAKGSYYAGRTAAGNACLLIRTKDAGRTIPLVLAGLEAHFGVPCTIREHGAADRTETLTALICLLRADEVESYFGRVCDGLVAQLGEEPTSEQTERGVESLVSLFQRLSLAPQKSITGLAGELCVIHEASRPDLAVEVWRTDKFDKVDFGGQVVRLETKASATRQRRHSFALEQLRPPKGCLGLVASVFIEELPQGTALADLLDAIEGRIRDVGKIAKLRSVVAATLGSDLPAALRWRVDLPLAQQSLRFFEVKDVPSLTEDIPAKVTGVRFTSDISDATAFSGDVWTLTPWST